MESIHKDHLTDNTINSREPCMSEYCESISTSIIAIAQYLLMKATISRSNILLVDSLMPHVSLLLHYLFCVYRPYYSVVEAYQMNAFC